MTSTIDFFCTAKARAALLSRGVMPRDDTALAEWISVHRADRSVQGVVVDDVGAVLATTVRVHHVTYIDRTGTACWGLQINEVRRALREISRKHGSPVAHLTRSELCMGPIPQPSAAMRAQVTARLARELPDYVFLASELADYLRLRRGEIDVDELPAAHLYIYVRAVAEQQRDRD